MRECGYVCVCVMEDRDVGGGVDMKERGKERERERVGECVSE